MTIFNGTPVFLSKRSSKGNTKAYFRAKVPSPYDHRVVSHCTETNCNEVDIASYHANKTEKAQNQFVNLTSPTKISGVQLHEVNEDAENNVVPKN